MCFSFHVAAFRDKAGKFTCEIITSDKYNSSETELPSKEDFPSFQNCGKNFILKYLIKAFL